MFFMFYAAVVFMLLHTPYATLCALVRRALVVLCSGVYVCIPLRVYMYSGVRLTLSNDTTSDHILYNMISSSTT